MYIVDQDLRKQLEAELRNVIKVKSELSEIRTREGIQLAETASQRRLQQESLDTEREKSALAREKLRLQKELERDQIESAAPNQLLQLEKEMDLSRRQIEAYPLAIQAEDLRVRKAMLADRARQELRREILPMEQTPAIAEALSRMLQGMNLSVYGTETPLLAAVTPLLDLLTARVKGTLQRGE